jgi:archaellum component FlaG (FlaF/FlaG flagellin family)
MDELSIVIMCLIAGALWAVMSYSVGFKEGQRQGYTRGRAVSRHISHQPSIIALPSDIKFSDDQLESVLRHISQLNEKVDN